MLARVTRIARHSSKRTQILRTARANIRVGHAYRSSTTRLYISKGSGGNGINTVYQVGSRGTLPTGPAAQLATVPITILPGFPNTAASTSTAFPFGLWFADAYTLYVCDEGDGTYVTPPVNGNVADAQSLATAGLQKWSLVNGTWTMLYVLQDGLNIGVVRIALRIIQPHSIPQPEAAGTSPAGTTATAP